MARNDDGIMWQMWDEQIPLPAHVDRVEQHFQALKSKIHQKMVESLDLSRIGDIDRQLLVRHVRHLANEASHGDGEMLSQIDQERLLDELMWEVFGMGPIEPLMRDPTVTDILVNDPYNVYAERRGRMELTDIIFADEGHLMRIIQRIVAKLGRRIDAVSPMVDARLPDGSRVNAIVPPLALDGPALSIRRFGVEPLRIDELQEHGIARAGHGHVPLGRHLNRASACSISGGTGAGKTTLLNALSSFIPDGRADRDDRRLRRTDACSTATACAWKRAPENTEGKGRSHAARSGPQQPPHAARPHPRRRGSRGRGVGHAAGDEHRPRRFDDHHPLQRHSRRAVPHGDDGLL